MNTKASIESGIPRTSLALLLAAQFLVILPHLGHLPVWISALWLGCVGWRIQMYRMRARYPGGVVKAALMIGTIAGVYASRGGLVGLDAAVVLLIAAFILKLVEMRSRRDALVVIYLGFFAVLTRYLFDSEMITAAFSLLPILGLLSALIGLQQRGGAGQPWVALKLASTLVLQAIPLMLVLFLLFPRLGPLWSLPQPSDRGVTGLSDSMAPGEIAELSQSSALAFRASFEGSIPVRSQLYWRAITFDRFDGTRWTHTAQPSPGAGPAWSRTGDPVRYSVVMERTTKPWLFSLDVAEPEDSDAALRSDFRLERQQPVDRATFYRVTSWPEALMEPRQPGDAVRRALQLPAGVEPRAREWAQVLRSRYASDEDLAGAVLRHFRDEPYVYTLRPEALGRNAIDAFLFDTRRGFCEHYAGAMTFVLRAAGIPARIVTGYQGGEANTNGNYLQVRQFDAHAWSEYWIEGKGWIRADPTFQVAPERIELGLEEAIAGEQSFLEDAPFSPLRYRHLSWVNALRLQWDEVNYGWQRWVLGYQGEQQGKFFQQILGQRDTWMVIGAILGVFTLIVGGLAIAVLKPWQQLKEPHVRAFIRFERLLTRYKLPRHAAEGPRTYGRRASNTFPAAARAIGDFVRLYEMHQYAGERATSADLRSALGSIRTALEAGRNE
jgi:transglutaminase-like putative cysteine protease